MNRLKQQTRCRNKFFCLNAHFWDLMQITQRFDQCNWTSWGRRGNKLSMQSFFQFVFWAKLFSICTLPLAYSKMGLHTQMVLFVLLNADGNRAMWVQCMSIRVRLQTDLVSFNKHVICGAENEHIAMVGTSKGKDRDILLCFSHYF